MKKNNLVLSVLALIAVSVSSCSKSEDVIPTNNVVTNNTTVEKVATMTVKINDVQFNNFKPAGFPNVKATKMETFNGKKYLKIEGGDTSELIANYQLYIYIPESQWKVGTYTLNEMNVDTRDGENSFSHLNVVGRSDVSSTNTTQGTITITEFNKTTNKIKATFNFNYSEINNNGNSSAVFSAKEGYINYSLDTDLTGSN